MGIPAVSPAMLDALSASTRRVALAVIRDRETTMSVAELTSAIAADAQAAATDGGDDFDETSTTLGHAHLPILDETGAVRFDPETGLVALAEDSPFDTAWVDRLLADHPDPTYDATLSALASQRRQAVLYEAFTRDGTDERDIACAVAAHERGIAPDEVPENVRRVVALSLTHRHLPALIEVGLLRGDAGTRSVRAGDAGWRSDPWVAASPIGPWAAID